MDLDKILKWIESELIAKQSNGYFMKFHKGINCVVIDNMTDRRYID